jgi:hypothetical protein
MLRAAAPTLQARRDRVSDARDAVAAPAPRKVDEGMALAPRKVDERMAPAPRKLCEGMARRGPGSARHPRPDRAAAPRPNAGRAA